MNEKKEYKEFCFRELEEKIFWVNSNDIFLELEIKEGTKKFIEAEDQKGLKEEKKVLESLLKEKNLKNYKKRIIKKIEENNKEGVKKITYKFNSFVGIIFLDFNVQNPILVYPKFWPIISSHDSIDWGKFINVLKSIDWYYKHHESKKELKKKFFSKNKVDELKKYIDNILNETLWHKAKKKIDSKYKNILNFFDNKDWFFLSNSKKREHVEYKSDSDQENFNEITKKIKEPDKNFIIGKFDFEYVWEKSCCSYYDDNYYKFKINDDCDILEGENIYKNKNAKDIKEFINKDGLIQWVLPSLRENNTPIPAHSLNPDIVNIKKIKNDQQYKWEFNIYDAKYYSLGEKLISISKTDLIKQYFYELAFNENIFKKNKNCYLGVNALVFPCWEEKEKKDDYFQIKILDEERKIKIFFLYSDKAFICFPEYSYKEKAEHYIKSHYITELKKGIELKKIKKIKPFNYNHNHKRSEDYLEISLFSPIDGDEIHSFKIQIPQNE